MAPLVEGQEAIVTDVATGLGGTASCSRCGAQVEVPQDSTAAAVPCPKCGTSVAAGPAPDAQGEQTLDEVLRGFGVNGYDVELSVDAGSIRCDGCRTTSSPDEFRIEDVTPATDEHRGVDVVAAALVCPRCGATGRLVLDPHEDDQARAADILLPPG